MARIIKKPSVNFSSELWRLITCFSFPFMLSRRLFVVLRKLPLSALSPMTHSFRMRCLKVLFHNLGNISLILRVYFGVLFMLSCKPSFALILEIAVSDRCNSHFFTRNLSSKRSKSVEKANENNSIWKAFFEHISLLDIFVCLP